MRRMGSKILRVQVPPSSSEYPTRQEHSKLPIVFWQYSFTSQSSVSAAHSSKSNRVNINYQIIIITYHVGYV